MLQKLNNKRKLEKGFTIIEVMIVLAIAGLILVVVLIAIPQLQRNQRNSARQNDASRVGTSVSNWSANNNGAIFTAGTGNANLTSVINDLGALGQYTLTAGTTFTTGPGSTPANLAAIANLTNIRVTTGAICATNGAATTTGATSRQFVILYATETSNGQQGQCLAI